MNECGSGRGRYLLKNMRPHGYVWIALDNLRATSKDLTDKISAACEVSPQTVYTILRSLNTVVLGRPSNAAVPCEFLIEENEESFKNITPSENTDIIIWFYQRKT